MMQQTQLTSARDVLLNTALLGLDKSHLSITAFPPVLHNTLQTVTAQATDPVEAFVEVVNLVFAYEQAHSQRLLNTFTPEEMARLQELKVVDAFYSVATDTNATYSAAAAAISRAVKATDVTTTDAAATAEDAALLARWLQAQHNQAPLPLLPYGHGTMPLRSDSLQEDYIISNLLYVDGYVAHNAAIDTMAILAALRHMGLYVPSGLLREFVHVYLALRDRLPLHLQQLSLEFLLPQNRYLLSFMTVADLELFTNRYSGCGYEYSDDYTDNFHRNSCDISGHATLQLDLMVDHQATLTKLQSLWDSGSCYQQEKVCALLVDNYELTTLLDCLEASFQSLPSTQRKNIIAHLHNHWLDVVSYLYQHGHLARSADGGKGAANTTATTDTTLPATTVNASVAVVAAPSIAVRFEQWLQPLAQDGRNTYIQFKAAQMLWLLPHSQWQQASLYFVRKAVLPDWDIASAQLVDSPRAAAKRKELTSLAKATDSALRRALKKNLDKALADMYAQEQLRKGATASQYLALLTFTLPPAQWFTLFNLTRTSDDAHDAEELMSALAQYCQREQPYEALGTNCNRSMMLKYFVLRLRFELGTEYSHAFFQHLTPLLTPQELPELLAFATYSEREVIPFVDKPLPPSPAFPHQFQLLPYNFMWWPKNYCAEIPQRWGPKFSKFYLEVLLAFLALPDKKRQQLSHGYTVQPSVTALALSLDVDVREQYADLIYEHYLELEHKYDQLQSQANQEIYAAQRRTLRVVTKSSYDADLKWYRNNHSFLESLLNAFDEAQQIEQMCADANAAMTPAQQQGQAKQTKKKTKKTKQTKAQQAKHTAAQSVAVAAATAAVAAVTAGDTDSADVSAAQLQRTPIPLPPRKASALKREASIAGVIDELKLWIKDSLRNGLMQVLPQRSDDIARLKKRMVDAKAPKLSQRLDNALQCDDSTEAGRFAYLSQLLRLYLLSSAFAQREQLSAAWQGELSRLVGVTPTPEEVIAANHEALDGKEPAEELLWVVNDIVYPVARGQHHKHICYSFTRHDFVYYLTFVPNKLKKAAERDCDAALELQELILPSGIIFKAQVYLYPGLTEVPRVLFKKRQVLEGYLHPTTEEGTVIKDVSEQHICDSKRLKPTLQGCSSLQATSVEMTRFFSANPFAAFCPVVISQVNFAHTQAARSGPWYLCDREGKAMALTGPQELLQRQVLACEQHTYGHEFTAVVLMNKQHMILSAIGYGDIFISLPLPELPAEYHETST